MIHLTLVVVFATMQFFQPLYAAAALGGALVALAAYHAFWVRPRLAKLERLLDVHDGLIAGGDGGAADRLAALESADAAIRATLDGTTVRMSGLEALTQTDVSCSGFVRYDAFSDSESGLSYALALLNRRGDGVVLTSIYSREDTRTFGKAVAGFKPAAAASAEELEAIERARAAAP